MRWSLLATVNKDPTSYEEAMASHEREFWQRAVDEELESMSRNEVWELVDKPYYRKEEKKANIVDSKWVFKRRIGADGKPVYKARLVIRGFLDRRQYGLLETYAPVSRLPLIRGLLAIVNKHDLEICQMDVKTAFLNGDLEEYVYMKVPRGVKVSEQTKNTKVCKIKKALYGLKISPKRWNLKFTEVARSLGLTNTEHEPCLYTNYHKGQIDAIVLYVDDMLIVSNDKQRLENIKQKLNQKFEMKDLGEPEYFLGMKINRDRKNRVITINQSEYAEKILERFNMKNCAARRTPMESRQVQGRKHKTRGETTEKHSEVKPKVPYREAIGSVQYLAGGTRPDIAYAVNVLSRCQVSPTLNDWEDVKRLLQYIKGTKHLGLKYTAETEGLVAMTDSSYCDWTDSTSTSGFLIKIYGDSIAWRSHKQTEVYRSTTSAEYAAMSEACRELVSLDKAFRDITNKSCVPYLVLCDNLAAVKNTQKEGCHKLCDFDEDVKTIQANLKFREATGKRPGLSDKHGDLVKQLVLQKKTRVEWIETKLNTADIFTKPLEFNKHKKFTCEIFKTDALTETENKLN